MNTHDDAADRAAQLRAFLRPGIFAEEARALDGRALVAAFFERHALDDQAALGHAWYEFRTGLSESETAAVRAWLAGILWPVAVELEAATERPALAAEAVAALAEMLLLDLA
jgi:hypothetical protein